MPDRVIHLEPLNGTFERKVLNLVAAPVKIGRKVSQKVAPDVNNGLFESKVLSRNHAEIGCRPDGTFYIQDLGSSNGTFVNGVRLSEEGASSEQHLLENDDQIDFGVDILKDDNEVLYSRVSCKALLNPDLSTMSIAGRDDALGESSKEAIKSLLATLDALLAENLKTKETIAVLHAQVDDLLLVADAVLPSNEVDSTDEAEAFESSVLETKEESRDAVDTAEHLHHTPIGKTDRAEPLSEVPPAQPSATEGKELETEEGPSMKPLEPPDRLLSKTSGFTFIGIVAAVGVATHLLNR